MRGEMSAHPARFATRTLMDAIFMERRRPTTFSPLPCRSTDDQRSIGLRDESPYVRSVRTKRIEGADVTKRETKQPTTRKPRVTAKMKERRAARIDELRRLLPIGEFPDEPVKRFIFFDFSVGYTELAFDGFDETLDDARSSFSARGNWDLDPNPPPPMAVDLDADELAITAISYHQVLGMELSHTFELDALRDYDYVPEAGGHWSDAYHPVPRVNPAYTPLERAGKLREWLQCEWRGSWDDPEDE